MRTSLLFATLCFATASAGAVCLNPFGCEPKNYDECVADATKRPTELGVKLARQQCFAKWKQPEEEREATVRNAAAERRAVQWAKVNELAFDAPAWIVQLGEPDQVVGPMACSPTKEAKAPKGSSCYIYLWNDKRPGRYDMHFKAEVVNEPSKKIWAYWQDSVAL